MIEKNFVSLINGLIVALFLAGVLLVAAISVPPTESEKVETANSKLQSNVNYYTTDKGLDCVVYWDGLSDSHSISCNWEDIMRKGTDEN